MTSILARPLLPQSLEMIRRMSPAIVSAGKIYNVDPIAIAGAIALEQNNAEQFSFKYRTLDVVSAVAFRNGITGDNAIKTELAFARFAGSDIGSVGFLEKLFNPTTLDVGPARFRVALGVETVEAASESDPVLANYKGHPAQLAQDMTLDRGELTASLVGARLQQGQKFFESIMSPEVWSA